MASAEHFAAHLRSMDPFWILLALALGTFILEDVATFAAAYLASEGHVGPFAALFALIAGIYAGDLGLYGAGAGARRSALLRRWLDRLPLEKARALLAPNLGWAVFIARLIPGMRLTGYTLFGYLGLGFRPFALACFFSVTLWSAFLFGSAYGLGEALAPALGPHRHIGFVIGALLLLFGLRCALGRLNLVSNGANKDERHER